MCIGCLLDNPDDVHSFAYSLMLLAINLARKMKLSRIVIVIEGDCLKVVLNLSNPWDVGLEYDQVVRDVCHLAGGVVLWFLNGLEGKLMVRRILLHDMREVIIVGCQIGLVWVNPSYVGQSVV